MKLQAVAFLPSPLVLIHRTLSRPHSHHHRLLIRLSLRRRGRVKNPFLVLRQVSILPYGQASLPQVLRQRSWRKSAGAKRERRNKILDWRRVPRMTWIVKVISRNNRPHQHQPLPNLPILLLLNQAPITPESSSLRHSLKCKLTCIISDKKLNYTEMWI